MRAWFYPCLGVAAVAEWFLGVKGVGLSTHFIHIIIVAFAVTWFWTSSLFLYDKKKSRLTVKGKDILAVGLSSLSLVGLIYLFYGR